MINRKSFIIGIKGVKLSKQEIKFLNRHKPWGIILFSRNLKNINQIKDLTKHIRKIFRDKKYPIMIDQEGGRVNRLEKFISLNSLTSEYFGQLFIKNRQQFTRQRYLERLRRKRFNTRRFCKFFSRIFCNWISIKRWANIML